MVNKYSRGDLELTGRETQCLYYMINGNTAKETAKELKISPRTVEAHINSIKVKVSAGRKIQILSKINIDHFISEYQEHRSEC